MVFGRIGITLRIKMPIKMNVERVLPGEFRGYFPKGGTLLYNSVEFAELNADKCDRIHYLLLRDSKVRFGMIAGECQGMLCSPFSAPFGGLCANSRQGVEAVDGAVEVVRRYAAGTGLDLRITLPPQVYDSDLCMKTAGALLRRGRLLYADLNYHYDLSRFGNFEGLLSSKARNKFREAMRHDFCVECSGIKDMDVASRCYAVIQANRRWKGYPLRMTFGQVAATAPVAGSLFVVMTLDGVDVAAALIQMVGDGIGQLVYWGDVPGFSEYRPMNRLAFEILSICKEAGLRILDLGPASEDGNPSYGLCEFKESLGCEVSLKYSFELPGQME